MAPLTIKSEEEKRLKGMGFLNNKGTDEFSARILTVNGRVTTEQMKVIQEAAEKYGNGIVGLTSRLTFEVQGIPADKAEAFQAEIAKAGLVTGGTGSKVRPVVSCKGTICQYGQIDTFALSEKIHETFYLGWHDVLLPHKFKIAVGGCPNNCVKPDLNDLAVIGQTVVEVDEDECNGCKSCAALASCPMGALSRDDEGTIQLDESKCNNCGRCVHLGNDGKMDVCPFGAMQPKVRGGYKIYIGGRWGKWVTRGMAIDKVFTTEDEVMAVIEKAILLFREQGKTGERFAQTIERIGFENVQAQLLSDDILSRKQAILEAKLHLTGGAKC